MRIDFSYEFDQKNKVKKPTDKGLIQLKAYLSGKRKYFTTKIKVYPHEWNEQKQRIVRHANSNALNDVLDALIDKVLKAQRKANDNNDYFNLDSIKTLIGQQENKTAIFNKFAINDINANNTIKEVTKRSYRNTLNKLIAFNGDNDILFSELNYTFFKDFVNYLTGLKLDQNTIRKHKKNCQALIEIATKKGYYDKANPCKDIIIKEVNKKIQALTWEQILNIEKLKFEPYETRLETIRDMFLFSCYTGLRISDLIKLSKEHVKPTSSGLTLDFTAQKTNKHHVLPLYELFPIKKKNTTRPIEIIKKHSADEKQLIFKKYSEQLYNKELKEIEYRAKIDFKLTSHVGRKTCATYLPTIGVSSFVVKSILQHSNLKTTERYVKVDEKRVIADLKNSKWD